MRRKVATQIGDVVMHYNFQWDNWEVFLPSDEEIYGAFLIEFDAPIDASDEELAEAFEKVWGENNN